MKTPKKAPAMTTTQSLEVEIRQHPTSEDHWVCIVTNTRGRCYFVTWADRPTEETVLAAWREDRKAFQPYCG